MRRPHVYERSATRAARGHLPEPSDLLRQSEAGGAVALARHLGRALTEAEGIVRRTP